MKLLTTFVFALALFISSAHSATVTLIQDEFTRSGPLAGSYAAPIGGVWSGGGNAYSTNGTQVVVAPSTSGGYYYQSISLQLNSTYQLIVAIDNTTKASQDWMGFGFGGNVGTGDSILLRGNGDAVAFETAGTYATLPGPTSDLFVIQLVTGVTDLTNSSVTYFRFGVGSGGSLIGAASHPTDATNFNRVFIQDIANVTGTYDNFILTVDTVPEPSSLLLLGVAGLGLVRRRR